MQATLSDELRKTLPNHTHPPHKEYTIQAKGPDSQNPTLFTHKVLIGEQKPMFTCIPGSEEIISRLVLLAALNDDASMLETNPRIINLKWITDSWCAFGDKRPPVSRKL